jgi:endonuclease/exonuclease/phosphatase family metal-dependent hydrolase
VNPALIPTHLNVHRTALARLASDHFPLICELTLKPTMELMGSAT